MRQPQYHRETGHHRRAVLFPTASEVGELIWVHYDPQTASFVIEDQGFHTFEIFARGEPSAKIIHWTSHHWALDHDLLLISYPQPSPKIPPSQVNKSILALTHPLLLEAWRGPVVIVAISRHLDGPYCAVEDLSWRDLALAISYLRTCQDNPHLDWPFPLHGPDVQPALQLTDVENGFISSAFAVDDSHRVAPSLVPVNDSYPWDCCAAAHQLGLNWLIRPANLDS